MGSGIPRGIPECWEVPSSPSIIRNMGRMDSDTSPRRAATKGADHPGVYGGSLPRRSDKDRSSRAGRRRPASSWMDAPEWIRVETEDERQGTNGVKKIEPTILAKREARRARLESVMVRWFNGTEVMCPRQTLSVYFGDIQIADN